MTTSDHVDINAWLYPWGARIVPETEAAFDWCEDHIFVESQAGAYLAEHRYAPDILKAAHDSGLTVAVDGQVADAPRETEH